MKPLKTKVQKLRTEARGSLRQADVANYMRRKRHPVETITVGDFERGKYLPADPFLNLYAECVGQPVSMVREAFEAARKDQRKRTAKARRGGGR